MDMQEKLWIASKYAEKGYDFDALHYGDDLYGREEYAEEIWDYVEEYKKIGSVAFREKYKNYKLYS